jgi:hypothetical protein
VRRARGGCVSKVVIHCPQRYFDFGHDPKVVQAESAKFEGLKRACSDLTSLDLTFDLT